MDLVIRDARVVDGTGAPSYRADVGITDGRITEIRGEGDGPRPTAARTLDADGLALSPGFIDMHAHSDLALLRDPDHSAKAAQGVTLEVLGQDGLSYAPADDRTLAEVRRSIAGWNGDGKRHRLRLAHRRRLSGPPRPQLRRRGHRRQRRLPHPAGHRPDARRRLGRPPRHRRRAGPHEGARRPGHGRGRGRHVLGPDVHPRDVREGRRTHRTVPGGGGARRLLLPAPPLVRGGSAPGVRGDGAAHPRRRLRTPSRPRHDELRREQGQGTRAPLPPGRGARRRARTSRSTPIRTRPAARPSWRCCRAGRTRAGPSRS